MGIFNNLFGKPKPRNPEDDYVTTLTPEDITVEHPRRKTESIKWADILEISLINTDDGPAAPDVWLMLSGKDSGCLIPQGSKGWDEVYNIVSKYEGFNFENFIASMACAENKQFPLWKWDPEKSKFNDIHTLKQKLEGLSDLEWFDAMCRLLKKENKPTVEQLLEIIGTEIPNPDNEIRGSKFLNTFDPRFKRAIINHPIPEAGGRTLINHFGLYGGSFSLKISDITQRFPEYRMKINTYDGGTQIFFYPVSLAFEFSAIDCWTSLDESDIKDPLEVIVNSVDFRFGEEISESRVGYSMKRVNFVA
jgi:hypothetical protein